MKSITFIQNYTEISHTVHSHEDTDLVSLNFVRKKGELKMYLHPLNIEALNCSLRSTFLVVRTI
jgi:hypothetical protein